MGTFLGKKYDVSLFLIVDSSKVNLIFFQPGKPRKSEGWEKIYVASFGAGS
jgi:hypothetical protein